jgi:predicted dehydrogenase
MGVIGVGYLGQHHARIYSEIEDADLVAVADTDSTKAADVAGTYGCMHYASYSDIFELCDAISIATPTTTHYRVAMDCLEAGKDILIEKPITEDIGEAEAIITEAEKRGRIIQVGHLERYNQGIITASEFIGEPRFIESERISPFLGRGTDVDVTLDLMIHDIDLIISIIHSKLRDIRAIGESIITEKIDVAKAWLEFENGCTALRFINETPLYWLIFRVRRCVGTTKMRMRGWLWIRFNLNKRNRCGKSCWTSSPAYRRERYHRFPVVTHFTPLR